MSDFLSVLGLFTYAYAIEVIILLSVGYITSSFFAFLYWSKYRNLDRLISAVHGRRNFMGLVITAGVAMWKKVLRSQKLLAELNFKNTGNYLPDNTGILGDINYSEELLENEKADYLRFKKLAESCNYYFSDKAVADIIRSEMGSPPAPPENTKIRKP